MLREDVDTFIPILYAYRDGKTIQLKCGGKWYDEKVLDFSLSAKYYRIKPKAKTFNATYKVTDTLATCLKLDNFLANSEAPKMNIIVTEVFDDN